jgi:hypothetical protein
MSGFSYFSCGRPRPPNCSTPGCARPGALVCTAPVKLVTRSKCGRPVCERCAVLVEGNACCAVHGRAAAQAGKVAP